MSGDSLRQPRSDFEITRPRLLTFQMGETRNENLGVIVGGIVDVKGA